MLRKSLITILMVAASMPAWGFDIKAGLWEVTRETESPFPDELESEAHYVECIPQEDINDPEGTFRSAFAEMGINNFQYSEIDNVINVKGVNTSYETDVTMDVLMTILSSEHTRTVTKINSYESATMVQEAHWIKEDC